MSNLIALADKSGTCDFLAIIKEGILFDLYIRNHAFPVQSGQVYYARLGRLFPQTKSALFDLGNGLQAYATIGREQKIQLGDMRQVVITAIHPHPKEPECRILPSSCPSQLGTPSLHEPAPPLFEMAYKNYPDLRLISDQGLGDYWHQIEQLKQPLFDVGDGITLFFEKTQAAHIIDMNSTQEKGLLNSNIKAAMALMAQIRLRNLSGIILCDFLKMPKKEMRDSLLAKLRSRASLDPVPTKIHGFTRLGLLEITRQRKERELSESWV